MLGVKNHGRFPLDLSDRAAAENDIWDKIGAKALNHLL